MGQDPPSETACITTGSSEERARIVSLASTTGQRLRDLSRWLTSKPEVLDALKYKYGGIGKGKKAVTEETEVWCQHFQTKLQEIESPELLDLLTTCTLNWLQAYTARVGIVTRLWRELAGNVQEESLAAPAQTGRPPYGGTGKVRGDAGPAKRARHATKELSSQAQADEDSLGSQAISTAHRLSRNKRSRIQSTRTGESRRVSMTDRGTSPIAQVGSSAATAPEIASRTAETRSIAQALGLSGSDYKTASQHNTQASQVAVQQISAHSSQETPPSPVSLQDSPAPPAGQPAPNEYRTALSPSAVAQLTAFSANPPSSMTVRSLSALPSSNPNSSLARMLGRDASVGFQSSGLAIPSSAAPPNPTPAYHKIDSAHEASSDRRSSGVLPHEWAGETQATDAPAPPVPSPHKELIAAAVEEARRKRLPDGPASRTIFGGLIFPTVSAGHVPVSTSPAVPMRRSSSSAMTFSDIERSSPQRQRPRREERQLIGIEAFLEDDAAR